MELINHEGFTHNYTNVYCEEKGKQKFNAPHHFVVKKADSDETVCTVDFQEGPIKENGVNGCSNEDLLLMVMTRLESFQNSEYKCEENAEAIKHLNETIAVLRSRTNKRVARGVEGTSTI